MSPYSKNNNGDVADAVEHTTEFPITINVFKIANSVRCCCGILFLKRDLVRLPRYPIYTVFNNLVSFSINYVRQRILCLCVIVR